MFQCYSLKSSHPRLLPQSPKDCSIHVCLFCCLAYRVIVTIFLNSINKGTFHAKMGSIKDRNGRNLTEPEDIKKRWQVYTEELYKKDLNDLDNHDDVVTHLEPDILECEVKWALESITMNKASGDDGIPGELSQILKDDAVKVVYSICQETWKAQQWP